LSKKSRFLQERKVVDDASALAEEQQTMADEQRRQQEAKASKVAEKMGGKSTKAPPPAKEDVAAPAWKTTKDQTDALRELHGMSKCVSNPRPSPLTRTPLRRRDATQQVLAEQQAERERDYEERLADGRCVERAAEERADFAKDERPWCVLYMLPVALAIY